jgi:hypothetical protein
MVVDAVSRTIHILNCFVMPINAVCTGFCTRKMMTTGGFATGIGSRQTKGSETLAA